MFIQDTLTPNCRIPGLDKDYYKNGTIYTFHYNAMLQDGGHLNRLQDIYRNTILHDISKLPPDFKITGAAHSSFIVNKNHVKFILHLENVYVTKKLSKSNYIPFNN